MKTNSTWIPRLALLMAAAIPAFGQTMSLDELVKKGALTGPRAGAPTPNPQLPTPNQNSFHMNLLPGWHAGLTANGAVVAASGDGAAVAIIAPVTAFGQASPADWLRRSGSAALAAYLKGAAISAVYPSRAGRSAALASVDYSSPAGPGSAHVLCFMGEGVGTLYVIAAPKPLFARLNQPMVQMLESFSFNGERVAGQNGARTGAPALNVSFKNATDPAEGAFSMDIPEGWKVQGGTVRKSTLDYRMYCHVTSPDGQIVIRLGDPELGTFTMPTQLLAMAGMREGQVYSPGYGNYWLIMRYLPGPLFSQQYAAKLARAAQVTDLRMKETRNRPDLAGMQNISGTVFTVTAGETDFTCNHGGHECAGAVLASTEELTAQGTQMGIWFVSFLTAYIAPMERAAEADAILQHMLHSFRIDLAWAARQQKTTMDTSQITRDAAQYFSKVHTETYWANQRVHDNVISKYDDYIRGVVRLRDPHTGEEYEGIAGKNYYYLSPNRNRPIGTNRPIEGRDRIDVRELEQIR